MKASMQIFTLSAMTCLSLFEVDAHLTMVSMMGETNGYKGTSFGEMEGVPRNGTARFPFQADSGVIRQGDIDRGTASVCGRTLMGPIDMKVAFQKAENEGLPDLAPGGRITITTHQINADGAGPYSCAVDTGATGEKFVPIPIEVNIPGANGRSDARAIDLPLVARMPSDMICTGGADKQTCLIRCMNGAKAGPFGGCLAFTQKTGAAENANPLGPDADIYTPAIEALKQKAQDNQNQITIMPIAKKIIPLNLTPNRRSLVRRQAPQGPQLMVYPPVSRIANTSGTTPASTSFGTNLDGSGMNDNNGGNGSINNTKQPIQQTPPPIAKGKASARLRRREAQGYVPAKTPTTEGTLFEIATGPLGQADVPKNAQKPKDLKVVQKRTQHVFQLDE
ncbi:hypothetical protein MJO28_015002 [Puccinia striiformis f. sp. tritici]|uniref:Secreted protein n=2 Tax=Puccinia striiformis f. sp. tritici TaxID=168172 RepID=A0A0L0VHD1_9BASI|nr:hypothetical protein Pst134EA_027856 [Puccinia striiformis f. sp. tritici]KAH9448546.1 hypothetical protein Pst134EA_027856 [Puccinia striiformis f. sp. tritici]KAI7938082.1 hypothetical protein MJO28_015002 [Puccinia striiformis f. sp. tritici]KAI9616186.1 hypothetical protein KEM48_005445 [Puccinia striiformis f. sp. tritici PST-130]KNE98626.1 hypothetical protein PSTG_08178 [Puccinia striiformis f. sp. tritici PST-78]